MTAGGGRIPSVADVREQQRDAIDNAETKAEARAAIEPVLAVLVLHTQAATDRERDIVARDVAGGLADRTPLTTDEILGQLDTKEWDFDASPRDWQDAGHPELYESLHVYADRVERTDDGDAYRLVDSSVGTTDADAWYISTRKVQQVRPPDHPGHPNQLGDGE